MGSKGKRKRMRQNPRTMHTDKIKGGTGVFGSLIGEKGKSPKREEQPDRLRKVIGF